MNMLKFQGDIELDEVFNRHKIEIYDNLLKSIRDNYQDKTKGEVTIVKISINATEYSINLSRDKFITGLEGAIAFYESQEEYEKCAECLTIITALKNNHMEVN